MIGAVSATQTMTAAQSAAGSVAQSADYAAHDTLDAQETQSEQSGGALQTLNEQTVASAVKQAQKTEDAKADKKQQDDKDKQDEQKLNEDQVDYITKELNKLMSKINCNLQFTYHKELNTMSVKMLDKKTHEVIKEVPPEKLIKHMIKAKDWLGAFLDKKI